MYTALRTITFAFLLLSAPVILMGSRLSPSHGANVPIEASICVDVDDIPAYIVEYVLNECSIEWEISYQTLYTAYYDHTCTIEPLPDDWYKVTYGGNVLEVLADL